MSGLTEDDVRRIIREEIAAADTIKRVAIAKTLEESTRESVRIFRAHMRSRALFQHIAFTHPEWTDEQVNAEAKQIISDIEAAAGDE